MSFILMAHVHRDFLDAGRGYKELESRALAWKERMVELYHRNQSRLEHRDSERPREQQTEAFNQHHQSVQETLQEMNEARRSELARPPPSRLPPSAPFPDTA